MKLCKAAAMTVMAGALLFTSAAQAQLIYIDISDGGTVKPGRELRVDVNIDLGPFELGSYKLPIEYDENLLILKYAASGSDPEMRHPVTEDLPLYPYLDLTDESDFSMGCLTSGPVTLATLVFEVRELAPPGQVSHISFSTSGSIELFDCAGEDLAVNLADPSLWGEGTFATAPFVEGAAGAGKFMDLDGDALPEEEDAELLRKIVRREVTTDDGATLLAINARQCDINGNAITDLYDSGRFDALVRPSRLIHSGPDGICNSTAEGDDVQVLPPGAGEPSGVVIRPGFNYVLDTTPLLDDVVSGRRILAGPNGIADTFASKDDVQVIPVGKGEPNTLCVLPGPDQSLSTPRLQDDSLVEDPKDFALMTTQHPQAGTPVALKKISPRQDPLYLDRPLPVPLTVAVLDRNGKPKAGISPEFHVISGTGTFDLGPGNSTSVVTNLETDLYADAQGNPRGTVTAVFTPGPGGNTVEVLLPSNAGSAVPAAEPVYFEIEVLDQETLSPDTMTITAIPQTAFVGDTIQVELVIKDGATPVHGLADRITFFTKRNTFKGMNATSFGQDRVQAVYIDQFETGDFSGGDEGAWNLAPGGAQIEVTNEASGMFGSYSAKFTAAEGQNPQIWRTVSTAGYRDVQIAFEYSFLGAPLLYGSRFIAEYSLDGAEWRELKNANDLTELAFGGGMWMYSKLNLKGISALNDSEVHIRFTLDSGLATEPQTLYLDNVAVSGVMEIFEENFESYFPGEFPGSLEPSSSFINSGLNGVLDSTPAGDDTPLFPQGNGQAYTTIIYPGPNGILDSDTLGDDVEGSGQTINSGPNGVAESVAGGDDYQEIPPGQGKPFTTAILTGANLVLDSVAWGDDEKVGETGPDPRIEVDDTIYPDNTPGGQGNSGSDNFLFIGRATAGNTVGNYSASVRLDLLGLDQVVFTFYSKTTSQADAAADGTGETKAQEFSVEVSDNGGKTWIKVWDNQGKEDLVWTRHAIPLHGDNRFDLVDDFLVRWRASMDGIEDSETDSDGVYIDDVLVTAIEPPPDRFGVVQDTLDGMGTYMVEMSSWEPASQVWPSAAYWPPSVDILGGDLPVAAEPTEPLTIEVHKAERGSIQIISRTGMSDGDTFILKACESMDVMVVGRYIDTPAGQVEDLTRFFKLLVNGPARQTAPGVITADCFTGNTLVPINISAVPLVPGLYDPGGGGGGQQTGDVSGTIYKPNFQYASGAPVWVDLGGGDVRHTHANSGGSYLFQALPTGSGYQVSSSLQSYTKKTITNVSVSAGENTSVSFAILSGENFDGDDDDDDIDTDDDNDQRGDADEASMGSSSFDPDTDGDGYTDDVDAFPGDSTEWADNDNDGTGDNEDTDDDNDGISDDEEEIPGSDGYITDPKDADSDDGGENDGDEVAGGRNPNNASDDVTTSDSDSDGLSDTLESGMCTGATDPDSDDDGLCDGDTAVYDGSTLLCSAGEDMNLDGDTDSGAETDPCLSDTDSDLVSDYVEASSCMDGTDDDTDGDGLTDGAEDADQDGSVDPAETDPCDDDTDGDGMPDGYENDNGLDPLTDDAAADLDGDSLTNLSEYANSTYADEWDTDGDGLPDGFELMNMSGHTAGKCLDANSASDGVADFDGDGNDNRHEYWNGSDPWTMNPTGGEGCFYWGDAGSGDGSLMATDVLDAVNEVSGIGGNYSNVIPPCKDVQEMTADGSMTATDIGILRSMIVNQTFTTLNSRPDSLSVVSAGSTVAVGSVTHVTVSLVNEGGSHTAGFGVVFTIDTSSTASAELLGGDGSGISGGRYDMTGVADDGGKATIYIRPTSTGTIYVNAAVPGCAGGGTNIGRYSPEIKLEPAATIVAQ